MTLKEAIASFGIEEQYKFLLPSVVSHPLFIVNAPFNDDTKRFMLTHEHIVEQMRLAEIFDQHEEVRGGYCLVRKDILRYWGPSSFPIKDAGENGFNVAIRSRSISLIDMFGAIVRA